MADLKKDVRLTGTNPTSPPPAEGTVEPALVAAPLTTQQQFDNAKSNVDFLVKNKQTPDKSLLDRIISLKATLEKEKLEARYADSIKTIEDAIDKIAEKIVLSEKGTLTVNVVFGFNKTTKQTCISSVKIGGTRASGTGGGGSGGCSVDGVHFVTGKEGLDAFKATNPEYADKYTGAVDAHKTLLGLSDAGKCLYVRDNGKVSK